MQWALCRSKSCAWRRYPGSDAGAVNGVPIDALRRASHHPAPCQAERMPPTGAPLSLNCIACTHALHDATLENRSVLPPPSAIFSVDLMLPACIHNQRRASARSCRWHGFLGTAAVTPAARGSLCCAACGSLRLRSRLSSSLPTVALLVHKSCRQVPEPPMQYVAMPQLSLLPAHGQYEHRGRLAALSPCLLACNTQIDKRVAAV